MMKLHTALGGTAALALACASTWTNAGSEGSAALHFSSMPMLVDGTVPAPNVVLAIDGGPSSPQLPQAVRRGFGAEHAANASMRLAWQVAAQCEALPDPGKLCLGRNALQPLDDARRNELSALIASVGTQPSGYSSAPSMLAKAQAYLHGAARGSKSEGSAAACRKSYLLLATPRPDAAYPAPLRYAAASDDEIPAPSFRQVDTSASDAPLRLGAEVDTLLAESQGLPTDTVSSLAAHTPVGAASAPTLFASRYNADGWSGEIAARSIEGPGANAPWGQRDGAALPHTSASLLDKRDPETRVILTSNGNGTAIAGSAFRWSQLAAWQQAILDSNDALGPQRMDYLRGERAQEQSRGGSFRNRNSRQGDSINSSLWHLPSSADASATGREPILFLGSNGGMLHAFSASTGEELFAYVPQGAYPALARLTRPDHRHRYIVDGSPWTAETVDESGRKKTLVAGFMGAGGRGYFVLDVTDPIGNQGEAAVASRMVVLDTTASEDPDIGRITALPVREAAGTRQIARLNNGRWAMVIGNGYDSERGQAVLLIQFLDGARELLKLSAGKAGGNGLGAARLVDLDGDHAPDLAYAGDMQGQLWKFDLTGSETGRWKVASGGRALLLARDANGRAQPITAAPLAVAHPGGGRMVVLGTGRMLSDADRADAASQSIYGVLDSDDDGSEPADRDAMVRQAISPEPSGTSSGRRVWSSTDNPVALKGKSARRGWYVDLPDAGERVLANPERFDGKLVDVLSMAPSSAFRLAAVPESCMPPATKNFRTTLNALDGARPRSQLYGEPGTALNGSRIEVGNVPSVQIKHAGQERSVTFDGTEQEAPRNRLDFVARRAGWRQLQ